MRIRIGIAAMLGLAALASCTTTRPEKPILTRAAVRSIVTACHAVSGVFHPDAKGLPYATFVVAPADTRESMGDMCFARRLSAYRFSMMSVRVAGSAATE